MGRNLSVMSFDKVSESGLITNGNYALTNNTAESHSSEISLEHPFLLKGLLFIICLKGTAKLKIDYKEFMIKQNMISIILPNQILESTDNSEDHYVENLFFSVDFLNTLPYTRRFDFFNKINACPCLEVSDCSMKELIKYHSFIKEACLKNEFVYKEEIAQSLLYAFIALVGSLYVESKIEVSVEPKSREEEIVEKFSGLLIQHHIKERSASFYSDKLCITAKYLSRTLKRVTGRSINSWIVDAVILEAKIMLKSSDLTILQISEELNFPNPSFFVRYFKRNAGITPMKYREK